MPSHFINESERYDEYCRVSSCVSRTMYDTLVHISENMDFRQPKFMNRMKRNRSQGSVLAFVAELALQDPKFVEKLKTHMIQGGKYYTHHWSYSDRY